MKFLSIITISLAMITLSSCATPKFRSFKNHDEFVAKTKYLVGKSPKEIVTLLGKPMSAYYNDGVDSLYTIVYPKGNSEVSMVEAMFNNDLVCFRLTFEKVNQYKYQEWRTDYDDSACRNSKDEKPNTSLID